MRTWNLNLKISVADSWVVDGFDLAQRLEELESAIANMLPYADDDEVKVETKILSAPTRETLNALQDGTIEPKD